MSRALSHCSSVLFPALVATLLCGCHEPSGRPGPKGGNLYVTTTPADAEILVNGNARGSSPLILEDLPADTYLVVARRKDHRDARRTVMLSEGDTRSVELALAPLTGRILVHSSPPGATVTVADEVRGKTPILLHDLPYGRHQVRVELEGYQAQMVDIDIADRRPSKFDLVMAKDTASLSITSEPDGASVVINGTSYGETPCELDRLPEGDALVRIRKPGYVAYERTMDLRAAQTYFIRARLERIPGTLEVVTIPEQARVFVDDRLMGEAPVVVERLEPGAHTVRVEMKGHETQSREVSVDGTNTARQAFTLVANVGSILVTTSPAGVQVYVDGAYRGVTTGMPGAEKSEPLLIEDLPQGTRALQLSKRGYRGVPKSVVVAAGAETKVREALRPLFVPDTKVRTRNGGVQRGILVESTTGGGIKLEVRRGAFMDIEKEDILEVTPLTPESE